MVNTYQSGDKTFLDLVKLLECQYRVPHLLLPDASEKYFRNFLPDGAGFRVIDGTHRSFTGIGQTENGQFTLPGRKTAVTVNSFIDSGAGIFRFGFGVEKVDQRVPVVSADGIADETAQPVRDNRFPVQHASLPP